MHEIVLPALVIISLLLIASTINNNAIFGIKQQATAQIFSTTNATHYQNIFITNNNSLTKKVTHNTDFLEYKNPIYGIEIQYPSKWEKIDFAQSINGNNNNNNNNNNNAALIAGFLSTTKNDTGILE